MSRNELVRTWSKHEETLHVRRVQTSSPGSPREARGVQAAALQGWTTGHVSATSPKTRLNHTCCVSLILSLFYVYLIPSFLLFRGSRWRQTLTNTDYMAVKLNLLLNKHYLINLSHSDVIFFCQNGGAVHFQLQRRCSRMCITSYIRVCGWTITFHQHFQSVQQHWDELHGGRETEWGNIKQMFGRTLIFSVFNAVSVSSCRFCWLE